MKRNNVTNAEQLIYNQVPYKTLFLLGSKSIYHLIIGWTSMIRNLFIILGVTIDAHFDFHDSITITEIRGATIRQKVYCDIENPYCNLYCDTSCIYISLCYCSQFMTVPLQYTYLTRIAKNI